MLAIHGRKCVMTNNRFYGLAPHGPWKTLHLRIFDCLFYEMLSSITHAYGRSISLCLPIHEGLLAKLTTEVEELKSKFVRVNGIHFISVKLRKT